MRFEKIWIEQCKATRAIRRRFGVKSALDYGRRKARSLCAGDRALPGIRERISTVSGCGVAGVQSVRAGRICGFAETVRQIETGALALSALNTLQLLQIRKILACNQKPDGSSLPGSPLDKTVGFQGDDHLVHGRWAHPKVSLHVGLGGRPAVDLAVVVNEDEILSLFVREGFCRYKGSVPFSICT